MPRTVQLRNVMLDNMSFTFSSMEMFLSQHVENYSMLMSSMHPKAEGTQICAAMLLPYFILPGSWVSIDCNELWSVMTVCSASVNKDSISVQLLNMINMSCPHDWISLGKQCVGVIYTTQYTHLGQIRLKQQACHQYVNGSNPVSIESS